MRKNEKVPQGKQLLRIDEMSLEESQLADQLYNSAGLDPVIDAGLKDYDGQMQLENRFLNKVLGPRESDIKGYGESVARRVAFAVYALMNKQYGGKVGDLRSYIMTLEDERNRANTRYDELMGRVVGILGEEYKDLRTDSKVFMEKLNATLGEDLKESRIDHEALAAKLADIDGLRSQIITQEVENKEQKKTHEAQIKALEADKKELEKTHETQVSGLKSEFSREEGSLKSQIAGLEVDIKELESGKEALRSELEQSRKDYAELKEAMTALAAAVLDEEKRQKLSLELYRFVLKDSKVPGAVIKGVGQFIDFKKYLGVAIETGAKETGKSIEGILNKAA
jgi:predicted RNase H-like nuclease (RuvC/YqgF family)